MRVIFSVINPPSLVPLGTPQGCGANIYRVKGFNY